MRMLRWLPRFRDAANAQSQLKTRESWSRAQIEAFQLDRLNTLWADAAVNVPYYIQLKRSHELPDRFERLEHFVKTVSLLPKSVLRERSAELLSRKALPGTWKYSSGTTGRPAGAYWGLASHHESLQAKYRFYADWGVDLFDRTVFLWGPGTSPMKNWRAAWSRFRQPYIDRLRNRLRLSACDLSKPRLRQYVQEILAFEPAMIYGYSRALYLLALEAEAMGHFRCPSLKVIVASSEPCWPHMAETIERVLGAPVAREYGALECGVVATDSSRDRKLRVREDQVLVETLPCEDGQYDIVNTILTNPSFPLIRYVIGDRTDRPIEKPDQGFAILNSVAGRNNDFLRTSSGDYLHWVHIELGIAQTVQKVIRRFSMYQHRNGSVDIDVELDDPTRRAAAESSLAELREYFEDRLEGYAVNVRVVDQVAQTAVGKHRLVQSELHDLEVTPAAAVAS